MVKIIVKNKQIAQFILIMLVSLSFMMQAHARFFNEQPQRIVLETQIKSPHQRELIVLVHGLMRTSLSMRPLKSYLESEGYRTYYYSYPSVKYTIQQHGVYLNQFIKKLSEENPGVKIHFITHSLGGIIVREALSHNAPTQLKNIGCLIMLAPPNQGSKLATLSMKVVPIVTSFIKPLAQLGSDKTSYVHQIPVPNIKVGIIVGKYDAKVPLESARLEGQAEPVVVNSTHTFIMNNSKTKELIIHFLEKGRFS